MPQKSASPYGNSGSDFDVGSQSPNASEPKTPRLHRDEAPSAAAKLAVATAIASAAAAAEEQREGEKKKRSDDVCCLCGHPMVDESRAMTRDGPLHPRCVAAYKFMHQPRCQYCKIRFEDEEAASFVKNEVTGALYHPACSQAATDGVPYQQPTMTGKVRKFAVARSMLTRPNWKWRYFVLSPENGGIQYYQHAPAPAEASATGHTSSSSSDDEEGEDELTLDDVEVTNGSVRNNTENGKKKSGAGADKQPQQGQPRRSKGFVPLNHRCRLLTRPSSSTYRASSGEATEDDIGIIFYDNGDSTTERRLIFQCSSAAERQAWIRALEAYITIVDDPSDYSAKPTGDRK